MAPTQTSIEQLLVDLAEEHADLEEIVVGLEGESFDLPTPAEGWSVRDQLSHLAFFDDVAAMALVDPDSFVVLAKSVLESGADPMEEHLRRGRAMAPGGLIGWWMGAGRTLMDAARASPPEARVPWYGPPMGLKSFISARLMETWAHGQDVADALGVRRVPTDRLRHVAHLGVAARPFSYVVHGLEPPAGPVLVELEAPSGDAWVWGAEGACDTVRGKALDFCLVVTQRRHLDDTSLRAEGDLAIRWLEIAQAFAGPPGPGRAPGSLPS